MIESIIKEILSQVIIIAFINSTGVETMSLPGHEQYDLINTEFLQIILLEDFPIAIGDSRINTNNFTATYERASKDVTISFESESMVLFNEIRDEFLRRYELPLDKDMSLEDLVVISNSYKSKYGDVCLSGIEKAGGLYHFMFKIKKNKEK